MKAGSSKLQFVHVVEGCVQMWSEDYQGLGALSWFVAVTPGGVEALMGEVPDLAS